MRRAEVVLSRQSLFDTPRYTLCWPWYKIEAVITALVYYRISYQISYQMSSQTDDFQNTGDTSRYARSQQSIEAYIEVSNAVLS